VDLLELESFGWKNTDQSWGFEAEATFVKNISTKNIFQNRPLKIRF
jgi:hypothetical protein